MSNQQLEKIAITLDNGYRIKGNGTKVRLSDAIRKQYEVTLRAAKAKLGQFRYISVEPMIEHGKPTGMVRNYGPARRWGDEYLTVKEFWRRRLEYMRELVKRAKENELTPKVEIQWKEPHLTN